MEESVALDSSKQKQFVKSVRGIKKLLKKKSLKSKEAVSVTKSAKEPVSTKEKEVKKQPIKTEPGSEKKNVPKKVKSKFNNKIKKRPKRGLVYLSHIPHGFYEHQMTEYFKQFGVVTNARVIRSRRTGNSKGYAFVEFKEPTVAEIVAETMNNYLMGKRLIKAFYIPPKKQKLHAIRKHWNIQSNPASEVRLKMKKALNANKTEQEELKIAKKLLSTLSKTKQKLSGLGIEYDFFAPVDVPEALKEKVPENDNNSSVDTKVEPKKTIKVESKTEKEKKPVNKEPKDIKNTAEGKIENNKNKNHKKETKQNEKQQVKENKNVAQVVNKKQQKIKQQKLDEKGIKGPENFININESNDDDSSDGFDSDEFEKMIASDDDDVSVSGDESDESYDEEDSENTDNIKKTVKPNINKEKSVSKIIVKSEQQKQVQNKAGKRKNANAPVAPKKAKFEKQNKKTLSKVMKKRK